MEVRRDDPGFLRRVHGASPRVEGTYGLRLRVPLLCVPVELKVERFGHMTGSFVRGEPVHDTP